MVVALASLQMIAFLQPGTVDSQASWLGRDVEDSCLFLCVLIYWVETDGGLSICAGNGDSQSAKREEKR